MWNKFSEILPFCRLVAVLPVKGKKGKPGFHTFNNVTAE